MYTFMSNESKWGALLRGFLVALLLAGSGVASAATFDLWAKAGTTTLPGGATVNVWGYTTGLTGATDLVTLPGGPTLIVNQGDTVVVNLTNNLTAATAMYFQGQSIVPDTTGAAASGGTKTYTFTATDPGTYLYEAGLLPNSQHQAAMGLHGALIVRPATVGQAYNDAVTAYNDEAVLVLSEIDPALHANPAAFDMRNYAPKYFLINGKAYPATDPITSVAGNKVLLRYVNAGIQHRSMAVLGLRQNFVAKDAGLLPTLNQNVVAETLAPGQTGDAIATVPAAGNRFAVFDGSLKLHNSNLSGFGGMLTFVVAGTAAGDAGPTTSGVAVAPSTTTGSVDVALSAAISDVASGNSNVTTAEYFIDATGADGSGIAITTGTFGAPTASVNAIISIAQLAALPAGNHTIYVHGRDDGPGTKWGAFSSAVLNLDKAGPTTSGLTLTPNPSNGTVSVALHATGNDTTKGGSNIAAAEYYIGAVGASGSGTAMAVNINAPVASLDATIPCTLLLPCTGGVVSVHSMDALGNWGAYTTITLNVVGAGPVTSAVSVSRNPNNGALPLSAGQPVVRVTATMTASAGSTTSGAEGFIDTVGGNGTGFVFVPGDGVFNTAMEIGTADIPLATINLLSTGVHTIYVRGKDAAGNWGATSSATLEIERTAPTFTGIAVAPTPTYGATSVTVTVSGATDASGIAGGEYWIDTPAPGAGGGISFTGLAPNVPVAALATGNHTVGVRVRDVAGNWSATTQSASFTVLPDVIFANGFDTGGAPWGWTSRSTTNTTRLNATAGATLIGTRGLQAQGNNTNYVQYNFGTAANPASATFDARFYFQPNGNTSTGKDIFAAATTTGFGTQLFHVRYRLNAGNTQVQIQNGTTANPVWVTITNAAHYVEVVWQALGSSGPAPGTIDLYLDGVLSQSLATTSAGSVGAVRLGSVTTGAGNNTSMYFDAFSSKRLVSPLIGP